MKTAVILVGGRGSRMNYVEKALLLLHGKPILTHIVDKLSRCVDDIIVVARDTEQQRRLCLDYLHVISDEVQGFGPVAGIYSGLKASQSQYSFVVACDMPFINVAVVDLLFRKADGYDVAIPYPPEPLHAVYKRNPTIKAAKKAIEDGKGAIMYVVDQLKANFVPKDEIQMLDPSLCTFVNINNMEDLKRLTQDGTCD
jgi:molybdopterin-guanine dinucleotide biosynthesis protein A